jgi:hypothetical protein
MDSLASHGDERKQVQWFIAQRIAEERLKVIKSLAAIVTDPNSSAQEINEAEKKAVTLVQGWLRDTGNSVVKNVLRVRAPSNASTNLASAGTGARAANGSASATPAAAGAAAPAAPTAQAASPAPTPTAQSAATTPASPTPAAVATTSPSPQVTPSNSTAPTQEIAIRSFAEAAKVSNPLSDEVIQRLATPRFRYESLVRVDESAAEKQSRNPEGLFYMRQSYSGMIQRNLKVDYAQHPAMDIECYKRNELAIESYRQDYFSKLKQDDKVILAGLREWFEKRNCLQSGWRREHSEYRGFIFRPSDGDAFDISSIEEPKPHQVRPNIRVQGQGGMNHSIFLHWETDAMVAANTNYQMTETGFTPQKTEDAEISRRIYLNPESKDNARIFETIMTELNKRGLAAHGKVHDRSLELFSHKDTVKVRTDAIVIAVGERDAQAVLDVVLEIWEREKDSFAGRDTPIVPLRIGDGIALASEPPSGKSLHGEFESLFGNALRVARGQLGGGSPTSEPLPDNAIPVFREAFAKLAREAGMNPDNPAFRLVKEEASGMEEQVPAATTSTASTAEGAARPYPSAAERAHANAMRETIPTGDPDEAARQGRY